MFYINRFKRKIKGFVGEYKVAKVLNQLNKRNYLIFNDIKININHSVSQIDHVVVSPFGVFVIETKNYKGIIKGSENTKEWLQVLNQEKRPFYNPILQNKGHIYALQHLFRGIDHINFISVVVFTEKASLKVQSSTAVIHPNMVKKLIKSYNQKRIDKETLNELKNRLENKKSKPQFSNKQYKVNQAVLKEKCPKCGNYLINRVGKYGKFIGCTNYPSCNYTKN